MKVKIHVVCIIIISIISSARFNINKCMKIFIKGIYNVIWFFKIRILNISIIFLIFSDVKMTAKREQKKSNVFMYSGFSVDS